MTFVIVKKKTAVMQNETITITKNQTTRMLRNEFK